MKRDEVLAILTAHREQLQNLGVTSLNLFGSAQTPFMVRVRHCRTPTGSAPP